MNELNAAGNQVASFMNSLGAFSASPQLPFCHPNLYALFPDTPSPLFDLTLSFHRNTIMLCELISVMFTAVTVLLKCSQR